MIFKSILDSKLPSVGTSIFTKMSALAKKHDAINLSQGFPSFGISDQLGDLVAKYILSGYNQYAPMQGIIELREVIADLIQQNYGANVCPDKEITITSGATQALYTAITALIKEEDEVIVFTPAYDSYIPAIELNKGKVKTIPLKPKTYQIDWNAVKKIVNRKTRMIILNNPHNPTGAVLSKEDIQELIKVTADSDIILLSDEVYEYITFDGRPHMSLLSFPELSERSVVVSSFGKSLHATGWKIGYAVAPENIMNEFRKVHQFNVFCSNTPIQYGIAEFLSSNKDYFSQLSRFYEEKRNKFLSALEGSRFKVIPTAGTYFQLLDYSEITDMKDTVFAEKLTVENKIASIPVSVFYDKPNDDKVLRFCFAKDDETLNKAAEILCKI